LIRIEETQVSGVKQQFLWRNVIVKSGGELQHWAVLADRARSPGCHFTFFDHGYVLMFSMELSLTIVMLTCGEVDD
jgi:hypothetical protein